MQWSNLLSRSIRPPASTGKPVACVALAALLTFPSLASAGISFADLVAERNTSPTGLSSEFFPSGQDRVNRFNGALGTTIPLGGSYPVGGELSYSLSLEYTSNLWQFEVGSEIAAEIDPRFNAGAGWSLSFGELLAPSSASNPSTHWVYRDPRGQVSRFHTKLLDGDTAVAGTLYTRDGTYLRLELQGNTAIVAFPGGSEKHFDALPDGSWRFDEHRDLYGNWFRASFTPGSIVVDDSTGRSLTVVLGSDPAGSGQSVIDRVELPAFGGATATYQLHYSTLVVDRPTQDNDPATSVQTTIPVLTAVERPNGVQTSLDYFAVGEGAAAASGRLETIGLPTGGFLDYSYQVVELPKVGGALHTADVVGVATRTTRPAGSSKPGSNGQWSFAWSLDRDRDTPTQAKPRELTLDVTYPDGHTRAYKFSAFAGGDPANDVVPATNFFLRDYGFPFTKNGAAVGDPHYVSEEIYNATGQQIQTFKTRYQWGSCAGCWDQHPRRNGSQTHYQDGSGLIETTAELYDDLGRQTSLVSYDNAGEVPNRTVTHTYDHGMPAATAPWVLSPWSEQTVQEGSEVQVLQRCIEASTGRVLRHRTLAGSAPASHDLLTLHTYHPTGERATSRYFGGDVQPIAVADLCTLTPPIDEQYARFLNYQDGQVVSKGWLAADGSVFLETYSATLDGATGLVASRSGADGFQWSYTYDLMGRTTASVPPAGHGGATFDTFHPATGGSNQRTVVVVQGSDGTELSKSETEVDSFGQVQALRQWDGTAWRETLQTYDTSGRVIRSTDAAGGITRWLGYDALGRVTTIRPPAGSSHDRTYSYQGRSTTETTKIGKSWDELTNNVVEIDRSVTTRSDRFGRVIERHIADADGEFRNTTFTRGLDGGVRSSVVTDGTRTQTTQTPDRTDNRGFTVVDSGGDPIVGYDALGNLTEVDFGEGPVAQIFDRAGRLVEQRADSPAGALWTRKVYATASSGNDYRGGKLVSSLRINRDIPHLAGGEVHVEDTFTYTGDRGGLSERRTSVSSPTQALFEFVTSKGIDTTGEVSSLTFPDCDPITNDGFSLCEPRPARVMEIERTYGDLEAFRGSVGGVHEPWIESVGRDSAGRVTQLQLANGVVEDRDYSSQSGALERLTLTSPTTGTFYDSGLAQYDAKGKLVKLGTQRHVSENAYRLALPAPVPTGDPTDLVTTSETKDRLGQRTRRGYFLPNRWFPGQVSSEQVTEIYVYGPENRRVWNRRFNDYQAANYRNSEDLWYLVDPSGRTVREVEALTYYAGTNPQWSNAQINGVWMQVGNAADSIYLGGQKIGETTDSANAPSMTFIHRDFLGRRFAESFTDGSADAVLGPLF